MKPISANRANSLAHLSLSAAGGVVAAVVTAVGGNSEEATERTEIEEAAAISIAEGTWVSQTEIELLLVVFYTKVRVLEY